MSPTYHPLVPVRRRLKQVSRTANYAALSSSHNSPFCTQRGYDADDQQSVQNGGIARCAGVERLITQRERNRWCLAVAADDPALLAADVKPGRRVLLQPRFTPRALRPRVEVLTGDLVN